MYYTGFIDHFNQSYVILNLIFFHFSMIVWNAGEYGCELASQLSFWLVTTFYQSKPAPVFPFCPETVTQTWLCAQALTRMHINTISCSTGSNKRACTGTHTKSIHAASSKCSVWHQIRSHSIGSLQSASNGQKQMDFADTPSTGGGADSHWACITTSTPLIFWFACISIPMSLSSLSWAVLLVHSDELCIHHFLL